MTQYESYFSKKQNLNKRLNTTLKTEGKDVPVLRAVAHVGQKHWDIWTSHSGKTTGLIDDLSSVQVPRQKQIVHKKTEMP